MDEALKENIKMLSDIRLNTKPKITKQFLIEMSESYHKEELIYLLFLIDRDWRIAVTSLSTYNSVFNITKKLFFYSSDNGLT